jgi:carbonic anhydrase
MMQKLVDGIHYFQNEGFGNQRELFQRLSQGQNPLACFITCADSRIDPNLITNTDPGDLFIVRNVGNIIPPHGTSNGEGAAIEFAVIGLEVKDVIVCGHTDCGAMKGLLGHSDLDEMPRLKSWLRHAEATKRIIKENYQQHQGAALTTVTAEENVLVQLEHLRTLPVIASRLARGDVRLHGWMYKIESGEVFRFDPSQRQFLPLVRADFARVG